MITKTHLRSVVVPAWSAQPQHPMKSLQRLSLLPQRNRENKPAMPCNGKLCKGYESQFGWPVSTCPSGMRGEWWHWGLATNTGVCTAAWGKAHISPLHHSTPTTGPKSAPLSEVSPNHWPRKEQTKGMCQKETKPVTRSSSVCLLFWKKKWSSKIQWRFSILHTSEHGQAEIICSWARTNPWGTLKLYHTLHRLQNVRKSTATPNPQQHRCCVSLRSTCGIDCSLPNLCTFNRTLSALIHSSRKPHCSSSQSQSLLGRCCTALHADQWVGMSSTGIKIDSCFPSLCTN